MSGLVAGARRAWLPLVLALLCFALAYPAFQDLERLFVGLGVILLLLAIGVIGFTAGRERERSAHR